MQPIAVSAAKLLDREVGSALALAELAAMLKEEGITHVPPPDQLARALRPSRTTSELYSGLNGDGPWR